MPGLYDNGAGNVTVPAGSTSGLYQLSQDINVLQDNGYGNANVATFLASGALTSNIITSGNVSGNYILGDGSQLTNLPTQPGTYGNANVVTLMAGFGSNTISTTGNITGGYILGNGSQLTGLPATYGNANVDAHLAAFGSNVIVTTGNITGGYFIGDGSQLTNLPASSYGNANVAAFLPTYTGNLAGGNLAIGNNANILNDLTVGGTIYGTFAGNISGNLVVPGANTDVIFNNSGNAGASSNLQFDSATDTLELNGQANVTGNVTASYFIGNGSQLTGLPASYSNANVTSLLASFGSNSIATTGNITSGNIIANGQALTNLPAANIVGTVANAAYATNAGQATVADSANAVAGANVTGTVASATQANTANVANSVSGANVVGAVANATFATSAASATVADSANAVAGGNVTGQVANALVAGTVYTNAQPNITSVGTLSALTVSGNIGTGGILTDGYYYANGTPVTFGGGSTYGNANVQAFLPTYSGNIGLLGNVNSSVTLNGDKVFIESGNANSTLFGILLRTPANGSRIGFQSGQVSFNGVSGGSTDANVVIAGGLSLTGGNATVTAAGNITASHFIGNGRALSSITGANVTGTVANATYALNANVSTFAGTVTTNAQPNITSVGTLSSLAVTGNITTGGILTNGYYYANGTPVTFGGGSTYGDSNVNTLLASWGSNTLSTTGNVTVGGILTNNYYYANGTPISFAGSYGNANVVALMAGFGSNTISTTGNITGGNLITGGSGGNITGANNITATGNVTGGNVIGTTAVKSGAVTYTGTDGTTGQVLTTYGNGITYFSTVSGGGSPGGANTQIQFNDGGAFAGNALATFDKVTGNITLGNIVVAPNSQIETVAAFSGNSSVRNPGQITVGDGYGGNITNTTYLTSTARGSRLLSYDQYVKADNGQRNAQLGVLSYADLNAGNIGTANSSSRIVGISSELYVINGNSVNASPLSVRSVQNFLTAGTSANTGNANISGCQVNFSTAQVNAGSRIGNLWLNVADTQNNNNATQSPIDTFIGYGITPRHAANTTSGNIFGVYMPGTTNTYGQSIPNIARAAGSYYFLRCDDDLAQNKLGSLRTFHEYRYDNSSSSGTLTVNKNNGQVQYVTVSEAITTVTFSNFVVSATDGTTTDYQTDTVTLIFQQDATGRSITLPAASTTYKYAGGVNTMGTTANAVQMVSVTATYNAGLAGTQYLITVSPEFS